MQYCIVTITIHVQSKRSLNDRFDKGLVTCYNNGCNLNKQELYSKYSCM